MIDRVVEIANPAALSVSHDQLVIATETAPPVHTPLSELAVVLVAHPRVTLTQAVLSRIANNGGSVVTIDDAFLPASMLLPLQAHYIQSERFAKQTQMSTPLRKRLWKKIVQAKIRAQGALLKELHGDDGGLVPMSARVQSGDRGNLESVAARRYWPLVFGNPKFRRGGIGPDQNRHLDYGYTVLRALTARALCAAGLHPSIGIWHENRYDPFSLAADVMEPFRPVVDRRVFEWIQDNPPYGPLDQQARGWLLGILADRYSCNGEQRTLCDLLARTADELARGMCGEENRFNPPYHLSPCAG
ncbi:MAG TPA: type II CRISPR-associated endonuclease Cas1 [Clostridia bacterium]|nr:type II CRISPR-associated endonuclease Cas1 [Clostridia bacterium]